MASNRHNVQTMGNLAASLNLSRTAVSYALSDDWEKRRISRETRDRVVKLAEIVGYRRNQLAVSLSTRKSKTIGILVSILGGIDHELLAGAERALGDDYIPLIGASQYSEDRELKILRSFEERMIDGLIISPSNSKATKTFLQGMLNRGIPVVQADFYIPGLKAHVVEADNFELARLCTRHLIDLGHTKIAYAGIPRQHTGSLGRTKGYRQAMLEAGLKPNIPSIDAKMSKEEFLSLWSILTAPSSSRYTGIVSHNFSTMFPVFEQMGLRCPEDVSLAAIDSARLSFERQMWKLQPTVAVWSVEEMGRRAASLLLEDLKSGSREPQHIKIPAQLIRGDSTAPPPSLAANPI